MAASSPPRHDGDCSAVLPGLPDDLALLCLARIPYVWRSPLRAVCSLWRQVFSGEEVARIRRTEGHQEELLCLQFHVARGDGPLGSLSFEVWDPRLGMGSTVPPISYSLLCEGLNMNNGTEAPSSFTNYAVVSIRQWLIVLGGTFIWRRDNHRIDSNRVWAFNFEEHIWRQLPSMSCSRKRFAAVCVGKEEVLVTGGFLDTRVEMLNVAKGVWKEVASMPSRSFYPSAALEKDGLVFVVPQTPSIGGPREALLYSVKLDKWKPVQKFWPAEGSLNTCHAMAVLNHHLYGVCGNQNDSGYQVSVFRRDPEAKLWKHFSPLLAAGEGNVGDSCHHFMVSLNGKLHVVETAVPVPPGTGVPAARARFAYLQVFNDTIKDSCVGKFSSQTCIAPMHIQKWKVSEKMVSGVYVLTV